MWGTRMTDPAVDPDRAATVRKVSPSVVPAATTALAHALGHLHRRAGHGAVRAKHAAVADLRLEDACAVRAVEKVLAGIRRHRLLGLVPAVRAGDDRLQLDQNPMPPIGRTRLLWTS